MYYALYDTSWCINKNQDKTVEWSSKSPSIVLDSHNAVLTGYSSLSTIQIHTILDG